MTEEKKALDGLSAIHQAIDAYYEIIATPGFKELDQIRSARHAEGSAAHLAWVEGEKRLIDMLKNGNSIEEIIKVYKGE